MRPTTQDLLNEHNSNTVLHVNVVLSEPPNQRLLNELQRSPPRFVVCGLCIILPSMGGVDTVVRCAGETPG